MRHEPVRITIPIEVNSSGKRDMSCRKRGVLIGGLLVVHRGHNKTYEYHITHRATGLRVSCPGSGQPSVNREEAIEVAGAMLSRSTLRKFFDRDDLSARMTVPARIEASIRAAWGRHG